MQADDLRVGDPNPLCIPRTVGGGGGGPLRASVSAPTLPTNIDHWEVIPCILSKERIEKNVRYSPEFGFRIFQELFPERQFFDPNLPNQFTHDYPKNNQIAQRKNPGEHV